MSVQRTAEPTLEAVRHAREAIEYCYERGWTDGLPVVPPAEEFVEEFLAQVDRDPEEVVIEQEHLGRKCTLRLAAANAVMAGCKPEYFPVVLAALDALNRLPGVVGCSRARPGKRSSWWSTGRSAHDWGSTAGTTRSARATGRT